MDFAIKGEILSSKFWRYFKKENEIEEGRNFFLESESKFYIRQIVSGLSYRKDFIIYKCIVKKI